MKLRTMMILGLALCLLSVSCTKEDDDTSAPIEISVIFSTDGLGDEGFNDGIYRALRTLKLDTLDYAAYPATQHLYFPADNEEAESICSSWFAGESDAPARLLILASSAYAPMLAAHPEWKNGDAGDIMLYDVESCSNDVYTICSSLYGVCYETGLLLSRWAAAAPGWGMGLERFQPEKVAIVCANPEDNSVNSGRQGVIDAVQAEGHIQTGTWYLADKSGQGYNMQNSLFDLSRTIDQSGYGFAIPLCGGSQKGMVSYTRIALGNGTFCTCGVDADMSGSSGAVVFSLIRDMKSEIIWFITNWMDGKLKEMNTVLTLEDGFTYLEIGPVYNAYYTQTLGIDLDELERKAIEAETIYLK